MKEIDFLPESHKQARQRRMRYRAQYGLILCTFAIMCFWSFLNARSVSNAQAVTARQKLSPSQMQALEECARIKTELASLDRQASVLSKFDSKVNFAGVLAELSYLVNSKIILTQLDIQSEPLNDSAQSRSGSGLIRINKTSASQSAQDEYFRFKVVLRGMACDAGDVAALICNLEQSPYFCRIMPGFSRTAKIKERQVSEFEIACYLANYREVK
jgi:hypothetical protein